MALKITGRETDSPVGIPVSDAPDLQACDSCGSRAAYGLLSALDVRCLTKSSGDRPCAMVRILADGLIASPPGHGCCPWPCPWDKSPYFLDQLAALERESHRRGALA